MYFITWKYLIDRLKTFPIGRFFFYHWYMAAEHYGKVKQIKFYKKKQGDHRLVIHAFNYFHCVTTNLMEIIIDYGKIEPDFLDQFYALNINQLAKEFDEYNKEEFGVRFNEFVEKDIVVKRMIECCPIIDDIECDIECKSESDSKNENEVVVPESDNETETEIVHESDDE